MTPLELVNVADLRFHDLVVGDSRTLDGHTQELVYRPTPRA